MKKHLVYDIPTRIFHWLFAGLFLFAFLVANLTDDETPFFTYHMAAGLLLGFVVSLRLLWGVVGTRYARFSSFVLHPRELFNYFQGVVRAKRQSWTGHNPASSWGTLAMLGFALALAATGYLMGAGQKEAFEEVHELLAYGFLLVVVAHVLGLAVHLYQHRDGLYLAMINGKKSQVANAFPIKKHFIAGVCFLILVAAFALYLKSGLDAERGTIQFLGRTLTKASK